MYYYIDRKKEKKNTAGVKAPADIARICASMHMRRFAVPEYPKTAPRLWQKLWLLTAGSLVWCRLFFLVKPGDTVIYQHPFYANRLTLRAVPLIRRFRRCSFIALIHDLESLRGGIEGVIENREQTNELADMFVLKTFDCVICHNEAMRSYLVSCGFDAGKLVCLGLFDYLYEKGEPGKRAFLRAVAAAGNLAPGKSGYLYRLREASLPLTIHLYGINYEPEAGEKEEGADSRVIYHGSFSPEELPMKLEGSFGLVWDGPEAEDCCGNTGAYLRYNDPHKASLYLAAGMPVIIWDQAALAPFILRNGLGMAVSSLLDIPQVLDELTEEEYDRMAENALRISRYLRGGRFFRRAAGKCREMSAR